MSSLILSAHQFITVTIVSVYSAHLSQNTGVSLPQAKWGTSLWTQIFRQPFDNYASKFPLLCPSVLQSKVFGQKASWLLFLVVLTFCECGPNPSFLIRYGRGFGFIFYESKCKEAWKESPLQLLKQIEMLIVEISAASILPFPLFLVFASPSQMVQNVWELKLLSNSNFFS